MGRNSGTLQAWNIRVDTQQPATVGKSWIQTADVSFSLDEDPNIFRFLRQIFFHAFGEGRHVLCLPNGSVAR